MATKLSTIEVSEGFFARWVDDLLFTWLGVLLFTVVPAVLFASAIFSFGVLATAVLIGIPSTLFSSAKKSSESRRFRRLAVMLVVSTLTLAYVSEVDEQIPANATPLAQAIESFWRELAPFVWTEYPRR